MSLSIERNYTLAHRYVNTLTHSNLRDDYAPAYSLPMNIGSRLDQAMKDAGHISQAALSRASGVPQPTINRILKGTAVAPESSTLKKLAMACKVSFSWLVGESDDNAAPPQHHKVSEELSTYTNSPVVHLTYVTDVELEILTLFRESTEMGKKLIQTAAIASEKDGRRIKSIKKLNA
ncbi:hypothetical protein UNDKW_1651 [Undibacterium sp. KW1]|uniref:helix-turn-helix domain-containing protein n=1 Tax=Undibacterium sp. KW1 TaxID=2058624 RepID=UPI001331EE4F|nr:helix-turn-helix transcriptional regulator [Undibacterium sp. KW1]BBB59924.1 hypothetical protein UNDKW_1651 [Undibacterium sp. KW1]